MHLLAGGVYACVCAEWGAYSNSNSPIPSLSLQGKLLTQEDIYVTRQLFAFPSLTKAWYFGKGKVQGFPASMIESRLTPDLPARCKRKCSSPFGKGEVSVRNFLHRAFHHTYRCVAGGKPRLPQTC